MADQKILDLVAKVPPFTGVEQIPGNDAGADRRFDLGVIRAHPAAQIPYFTHADFFLTPALAGTTSSNVLALTLDVLHLVPIIIPAKARTYTKMRLQCTTGHASNVRLGAYAAVQDTGKPTGTAIFDSGDISMAANGNKDYTISWTPTPGLLYYLAVSSGGTASVCGGQTINVNGTYMATGGTNIGTMGGLRRSRTHGALGDESASTWSAHAISNTLIPVLGIQ